MNKNLYTKKIVLPRLELGSLDSKSKVLTNYTTRPNKVINNDIMPAVGLEPTTTRLKVLRSTN